jgi:hypothetical protein
VTVFAIFAEVLVRSSGVQGYGWADVASVATALIVHRAVAKRLQFSYRAAMPWLVAFAPPLFVHQVGMPVGLLLWLPAMAVVVTPWGRRELAVAWAVVRRGSS